MGEQGMRWHPMVEIEERGSEAVIVDAIAEALDGPEVIYLSVDIDVVDPGHGAGDGHAGGRRDALARAAARGAADRHARRPRRDGRRGGIAALRPRARSRRSSRTGWSWKRSAHWPRNAHEPRPRDRGQPQALGRVDADPHLGRLLRRRAVPRRPRRRADRAVGARGGRRRRREDAPARAVPLRAGHPVVGAPRREPGHRRRFQRAGDRVRARAGDGGRARRAIALPGLRRVRPAGAAARARRSTWCTRAAARSRGCRTWRRGRRPSRRSCAPGGIFYLHEGHPVLWAIDDDATDAEPGDARVRLLGRRDALVPRRGVLRRPDGRGGRRGRARLEPLARARS